MCACTRAKSAPDKARADWHAVDALTRKKEEGGKKILKEDSVLTGTAEVCLDGRISRMEEAQRSPYKGEGPLPGMRP